MSSSFRVIKDDITVGKWHNQLNEITRLKPDLENAKLEGILKLDFEKIDQADNELGELLINNPLKALGNLTYALPEHEAKDISYTITNFSPINQKNLIDLRIKHLNQLISIEGIVLQITSVKPRLQNAAFQCLKCGNIVNMHQDQGQHKIKEPPECLQTQGGCGRVANFRLLTHLSEYEDFQEIIVTNPYYEQYRRELIIKAYNNHCNQVLPGETITINGIYCIDQQKEKLTQDTYLLAQGYESSFSRNLDFTKEEQKQAKDIAESSDYWKQLILGFAPSIYGCDVLKEGALLQQFGGNWYDNKDGTTKRGSIHTLYVGDPGTVKSTLMQASARIAPIYTKTSGRGATVAGITAGAQKDPLGEGYILQAGALVRANHGICYLDEFDKLPKEVQGCLHTPMEQGVVEQSKMGNVNQSLSARTAIMASMNPKDGRFDDHGNMADQIDIDPALKSRFDLIFGVTDKIDTERDRDIANHIHNSISNQANNPFNADFLRKYVHHGKKYRPCIKEEVNDVITDWFINNRKIPGYHINWRHYEAIRRLTEAFAKARFSDVTTDMDAKNAIRIFELGLDSLNIKDLDIISIGITDRDRYNLRGLQDVLPNSVDHVLRLGFNENIIESLKKKNRIVEKKGFLYFGRD